jgi:hypothetical protein
VTAGQLAERFHLTTGAITGVIDRLEKAGFAAASTIRATGVVSKSCHREGGADQSALRLAFDWYAGAR